MRIGLFGGTFNPIHLGHIQVVQEVKEGLALDRIILIPSALPPHKEPGSVVDARDRMEMIRLAIADYPDFTVSDVELKRSGPSYTIDTVRHFKDSLSEDSALYLILGLDAFLEIDTWKSYMDLFLLVPFIVMARSDTENSEAFLGWETLEAYLKSKISEGYQFSPSRSCHVHDEKQPIFVYNVTPINISSTQIRQLIKKGSTIRSLVPKIVEDFIKTKGLYL
jgi:nicotinate-nucleotide adenylyltransferase